MEKVKLYEFYNFTETAFFFLKRDKFGHDNYLCTLANEMSQRNNLTLSAFFGNVGFENQCLRANVMKITNSKHGWEFIETRLST